jgi:peptidylprolyl isomerase
MVLKKIFFLLFCSPYFLFSEEKAIEPSQFSHILGHVVGKNLQETTIILDKKEFLEGLKASLEGKKLPFSEEKCLELLIEFQEKTKKEIAINNRKKAETFLQENGKNSNIVQLEEGKIQYRIERKGKGDPVQIYNSPIVVYKKKQISGKISQEYSEPQRIYLPEALPGIKKALVGMQEGEIRTVYIHPSLGEKQQDIYLTNSLLIYEIELLQADSKEKKILFPKDKLLSTDNKQ